MSTATDIFGEPLDWLFWPPLRPRPDSAWLGHIPFAHWIVGALRPRAVVELGAFSGASYAAFCDAIARNGLDAKAYAVDTWAGDVHMGQYGEAIFADLKAFNDQHFSRFSFLIRATFDDALDHFTDGSIDLLHIDGTHTYDAVRHDFETWERKLSPRAVVLFHDTNVRIKDFGVWKFWDEVRARHASFEFLHWHGLGVLKYGAEQTPAMERLFALDGEQIKLVQQRFEALGETVKMNAHAALKHFEAERLKQQLKKAGLRVA